MLITQTLPLYALLFFLVPVLSNYYRNKISNFTLMVWSLFISFSIVSGFTPFFNLRIPIGPQIVHMYAAGKTTFVMLVIIPICMYWVCETRERLNRFVNLIYAILILNLGLIYSKVWVDGHGIMNAGNFDISILVCVSWLVFYFNEQNLNQLKRELKATLNLQSLFTIPHQHIQQLKKKIKLRRIYSGLISGFTLWPAFFIKGSTCKLAFLISGAAFMFANKNYKSLIATLVGVGGAVYLVKDFTHDSGRFEIWHHYISMLIDLDTYQVKDWPHFLTGFGAGSFEWIGFGYQFKGTRILIMHNDYLQILFEYGLIGFVCFITLVIQTLYRLRNQPELFACATAYSFTMLTYFPNYFLLSTSIGLILIILTSNKELSDGRNITRPRRFNGLITKRRL